MPLVPPSLPGTPEDWRRAAESLVARGAALLAYDTALAGLRVFPGDVRLRQLLGLAAARSGAGRQARVVLEGLRRDGHADEETLGMLARTHKDLWARAADAEAGRRHLALARQSYEEAYAASRGYWSGINVATTAWLLDDPDAAQAAAREVHAQCLALARELPQRADGYWLAATLGEASLILGEEDKAAHWYRHAAALGHERLGDLVSTRRNARLILRHAGRDTAAIDACLPVPAIVVFSGHLIDRPDRPQPRFPPALEPAVRHAIAERLAALPVGEGYSSAAAGSDILFLETLQALGATAHVVLPFGRPRFVAESVALVPDGDWPARFDAALAQAADVVVASEERLDDDATAFEYGFHVLDGAAGVRADELDTELICLALWDGRAGDGPGGTETAVAHWRRLGRRVEIVDLARLQAEEGVTLTGTGVESAPRPSAPAAARSGLFDPRIVALLFADVPAFSRLGEHELPLFVEHYLGIVAAELDRLDEPPLSRNTWGDGIHAVFADIGEAGRLALRLSEVIAATNWMSLGFASELSIRIGLHAGPAYACLDPVSARLTYIGAHVSRAARIEPITPPGAVYASAAFAALARSAGVRDFSCAYVGPMALAKGYGTFPTYVVNYADARMDADDTDKRR